MKATSVVIANLVWVLSAPLSLFGSGAQEDFTSPDAAVQALVAAIQDPDAVRFQTVVGPEMAEVWVSGDPERDTLERTDFLAQARQFSLRENAGNPNRVVLYVGAPAKPFPAPLVRTPEGWHFDSKVGALELTIQRIRRNESAVRDLCRRYVRAQFDYFNRNLSFAQKIRSAPGRKDGLFWQDDGLADESPVGPLFARAAFAEAVDAAPEPFFGYYFKVLPAQPPSTQGVALDQRAVSERERGFALIAWPAKYGATGIESFLISNLGVIYYKDLGRDTLRDAPLIEYFHPDDSWDQVPPGDQ